MVLPHTTVNNCVSLVCQDLYNDMILCYIIQKKLEKGKSLSLMFAQVSVYEIKARSKQASSSLTMFFLKDIFDGWRSLANTRYSWHRTPDLAEICQFHPDKAGITEYLGRYIDRKHVSEPATFCHRNLKISSIPRIRMDVPRNLNSGTTEIHFKSEGCSMTTQSVKI